VIEMRDEERKRKSLSAWNERGKGEMESGEVRGAGPGGKKKREGRSIRRERGGKRKKEA
jgi:hypothetical protein